MIKSDPIVGVFVAIHVKEKFLSSPSPHRVLGKGVQIFFASHVKAVGKCRTQSKYLRPHKPDLVFRGFAAHRHSKGKNIAVGNDLQIFFQADGKA